MLNQTRISKMLLPILKPTTPRLPSVKSAYYAGGSLCLDVAFWPDMPYSKGLTEVLILNLDGSASSSIYGSDTLSPENTSLVRDIYLKVKGPTPHFLEEVKMSLLTYPLPYSQEN